MKNIILLLVLGLALVVACKPATKTMTPELFIEIENKILNTDLTPEAKEAVVKEYNVTLKQYEEFSQKVDEDPALKAKVGEVRLEKMQGVKK